MDGDKPITRREGDQLGFASVAEHLASSIVGLPAAEGFVFGIEGRWGSGKSTLINLTMEALKTHGGAAPEVITFSPWLVGDRDELLRSLFSELASLVAARRLGSPQHYRYYFAFSEPAGALSDDQVQAFIATAERSPADAVQMFIDFSRNVRPQGGTLAEVVIDRVIAWSDRIPDAAIPGILASFAQTMDSNEFSATGDFGERPAWGAAARAVKVLFARMQTIPVRRTSLRTLFTEGQALGWLTQLFRNEIFSHGLYGDRPEPEERRLLTSAEFEEVRSSMLKRYSETPPAELMRVPDLLSLLYAWLQGGGADEPKQWVKAQTQTDPGLLAFLSRTRSWAAARSVYYPLKRRNLENFLDFDKAVQRLKAISSNAEAAEADRQLASELLIAVEQDKDG